MFYEVLTNRRAFFAVVAFALLSSFVFLIYPVLSPTGFSWSVLDQLVSTSPPYWQAADDGDINEAACRSLLPNCFHLLEEKGSRHKLPLLNSSKNGLDLRRVLLIVHFNGPFYDSAAKVYTIYKRVFQRIVFCGPSDDESEFWKHYWTSSEKPLQGSIFFVPFGNIKAKHLTNPYVCLPLVLEKFSNSQPYVDGVLLMSDDVVLNYWNWKLIGKSLDKVWVLMEDQVSPFDIDNGQFCTGHSGNNTADCCKGGWMWPGANKKELRSFYENLDALADGSAVMATRRQNSGSWTKYWNAVRENLINVTGGSRRLLGNSNADLLYIGSSYVEKLAPLLALMGKHGVFLEIAAGTAVRAVVPRDDIQLISFDGEDWGQGQIRGRPFIDSYSTSYEMVHPLKLGNLKLNEAISDLNSSTVSNHRVEISTSCVYCNLIKLSVEYLRFINGSAQIDSST